MSEFKHKIQITVPGQVQLPELVTKDSDPMFQGLPLGSKLVNFQHVVKGGKSDAEKVATYGVYRTPEEFLKETLKLRHPFNIPVSNDLDNISAISQILSLGKLGVMKVRLERLIHYKRLAESLEVSENELKSAMRPDVRKIMGTKRLLLFKQMLEDANVGDENLFSELTNGFRLTGQKEASGQFRPRFKPAQLSVEELRKSSKWARHAIVASCERVAEDDKVATSVWEETMSQLQDGWIKGPFSAVELDKKFPDGWIASKRFGVVQGAKVRSVDDFSEFLVNSAVGGGEQIVLQGLDEVASVAKLMVGAAGKDGGIWMPSSLGEHVRSGVWDASWSSDQVTDVLGRAMGLKSAYKQLCRHPDDDWCSILAVWSPVDKDVRYFESVALPFGAVSAVNAFNRAARALRLILCILFLLVNTNFFDDFCQLEFSPLCTNAWSTAETVMKLLGWKIAMSEDKRKPFSYSFTMLGAVIDLSKSSEGKVVLMNKPSRVSELKDAVEDVLTAGNLSYAQLRSLRGMLLYAAGHIFGRCTQIAVQALGNVSNRGTKNLLCEEASRNLKFAISTLAAAGPRVISAWRDEWPVVIFTDGACEQDGSLVTHGAVLCDLATNSFLFFDDKVPEVFLEEWLKGGKKQVIGQAEVFPVWVAKVTCKELLRGRQVLWFLDNEAARAALVRSYSPVLDSMQLIRNCAWEDVFSQTLNWYARVPSKSNLSDAASRLAFEEYAALDFTKVQPVYAHDVK